MSGDEPDLGAVPRSRKEAASRSSTFYFTGKPCNKGHVEERYTSSGGCVACSREHDSRWRARKRAEGRAERAAITRVCKRRLCDRTFSPAKRRDQVFCSQECADLQGREDWKRRNKESVRVAENDRKRSKYARDLAYRDKARKRSKERYHSLTRDEQRALRAMWRLKHVIRHTNEMATKSAQIERSTR